MDKIDPKALDEVSDPKKMVEFLATISGEEQSGHDHGHGGVVETVREDHYKSHHIVVRTTYRIEVDGHPLDVPLMVDNEGRLHCHSLPNYQFVSAVALVRQVIDTYPEEFGVVEGPDRGPHGEQSPHRHGNVGGH